MGQVLSSTGGRLEELPIDSKPYYVFGSLPDKSDIILVRAHVFAVASDSSAWVKGAVLTTKPCAA